MIKIVTDSTAYLHEDFVREHDIRVVPLCVHFHDRDFKEGVDLSYEEFYARLKEAPELPTTSQPSAGEFHAVFEELARAGHEIVTVTISSRLSGTWNSAMAAKDMLPDAEISVVDSLSTSIGLQLMVEAAVKAIEAGASRQQVVDRIEEIKAKILVLFVVDTLEYLAKGGRIGNAKAFLGTLLKVKPILVLQDGAIEPLEQIRSKGKAKARMLEIVSERFDGETADAKAAIAQALVPDEAAAIAQELQRLLGCAEPSVSPVGPVIGTHTGPGVIAVAAYK
ncbi:MAG: DegV family protein [Anaerolineae bacterium]|nr:DegV family protein [Anaerolineae bacterium]